MELRISSSSSESGLGSPSAVWKWHITMSPVEFRTKYYCADEDQQHYIHVQVNFCEHDTVTLDCL
jgi:hypothetical protein